MSVNPAQWGRHLEGRKLAHLELEVLIGGGGMGAVFKALDTQLGRTVAVKVLGSDQTDEESLQRFRNEAQSAARLDHPHIARVYNVGEAEGWNFIVFEFIEGANIRELVERSGPLPLEDAISYTLQVTHALDHAFRREVVHRDIKPSNVLVTPDGVAKLVDMGLARLHHVGAGDNDLTATGVTLGTFDYISPEQGRDPRSADVRSDLYSLGCTLYYMLAGRPPFPEGTVLQKLLSHTSDDPPDIHQSRSDLPEEVSAVLDKMLAKDPRDRYQQPTELIGELMLLADDLGFGDTGGEIWIAQAEEPTLSRIDRMLPIAIPFLLLIALVMFGHSLWPSSGESGDFPSLRLQAAAPEENRQPANRIQTVNPGDLGARTPDEARAHLAEKGIHNGSGNHSQDDQIESSENRKEFRPGAAKENLDEAANSPSDTARAFDAPGATAEYVDASSSETNEEDMSPSRALPSNSRSDAPSNDDAGGAAQVEKTSPPIDIRPPMVEEPSLSETPDSSGPTKVTPARTDDWLQNGSPHDSRPPAATTGADRVEEFPLRSAPDEPPMPRSRRSVNDVRAAPPTRDTGVAVTQIEPQPNEELSNEPRTSEQRASEPRTSEPGRGQDNVATPNINSPLHADEEKHSTNSLQPSNSVSGETSKTLDFPAQPPVTRVIVTGGDSRDQREKNSRRMPEARFASSLAEAVQLASKLSSVKEIELWFNGPQAERPFTFAGKQLTIRAGQGYTPKIVFRPSSPDYPGEGFLIRVAGGELVWENVHIHFETPGDPYDRWALFQLHEVINLTFRDSVLTIDNVDSSGRSRQDRVSFFEIQPSPSAEPTMMSMPEEEGSSAEARPPEREPATIQLSRCVARGRATLLYAHRGSPCSFSWEHGLFITNQRLLETDGDVESRQRTSPIKLELSQVTAVVKKGLCLMRTRPDASWQPPLHLDCRFCIIVSSAGAPLVEHRGPLSLEDADTNSPLTATGLDNFYPLVDPRVSWPIRSSAQSGDRESLKPRIYWRIHRSGGDRQEHALLGRDQSWRREANVQQKVLWTAPTSNGSVNKPLHERFVKEYLPSADPENPARQCRGYAGLAGFHPDLMPKES